MKVHFTWAKERARLSRREKSAPKEESASCTPDSSSPAPTEEASGSSGATSKVFPFDGKCDLSKDADLTLKFPNGSRLRAHYIFLTTASPVLKKALGDFRPGDSFGIGDDSREAWILLLNLLHPGRRLGVPRPEDFCDAQKMEALAVLAQKYSIQCLRDYVDAGLTMLLDHMKMAIPYFTNISYLQCAMSQNGCLFNCLKLAASFDMQTTKKACLSYLRECLTAVTRSTVSKRDASSKKVGCYMAEFCSALSDAGHHETAGWIAQNVFSFFTI